MKAIVCTFDTQEGYAQLAYKTYMDLWPTCPFTFRIPYNEAGSLRYFRDKHNVELVKSSSGIRTTMQCLLQGIDDDEFVYWCIDDRWLKKVFMPEALQEITKAVQNGEFANYDAVKLISWRESTTNQSLIVAGVPYRQQDLDRRPYTFWHHHFIRAGVLKRVFWNKTILPTDYTLRNVWKVLNQMRIYRRPVLVPQQSVVLFGEPCHKGMTTADGFAWLRQYNCPLPPNPFTNMVKDFSDKLQGTAIIDRRIIVSSLGTVGSKMLRKSLETAGIKTKHGFSPSNHQYPAFIEKLPKTKKCLKVENFSKDDAKALIEWRVLFIFADPIDIVLSVQNRLQDRGEKWLRHHFRNMNADFDDYERIHAKDALKLERFFDAYYRPQKFPLLTLRYETLWNHVETISRFVGRPIQLPARNPNNEWSGSIPRNVRRSLLDPKRLNEFQQTYGKLINKINCAEGAKIWNVSSDFPGTFARFLQVFKSIPRLLRGRLL